MTPKRSAFVIVALLTLLPRSSLAQCMGPSGMSHDHGASTVTRNERKIDKAIHDLLSDEQGRRLLIEAILADSPFMRSLIERVAELPEWRAYAAARLDVPVPGTGASLHEGSRKAETSAGHEQAPLYTCPMHPDVQSDQPGRCPKCGMELQRSD